MPCPRRFSTNRPPWSWRRPLIASIVTSCNSLMKRRHSLFHTARSGRAGGMWAKAKVFVQAVLNDEKRTGALFIAGTASGVHGPHPVMHNRRHSAVVTLGLPIVVWSGTTRLSHPRATRGGSAATSSQRTQEQSRPNCEDSAPTRRSAVRAARSCSWCPYGRA